jgi:hypothetical protein
VGKFEETEIVSEGSTIRIVKNKNKVTGVSGVEPIIGKEYPSDLATTLQYAQGFGDVALRQFAKEHIEVVPLWWD